MALMRDILASANIRCFLHYGTLLGAIREKNFIPHDNDADMGAFIDDFDGVISLLPAFMKNGFVFNSQRCGRMLQFTRKGEQIDLFFAVRKSVAFGHRWAIDERVSVPAAHLDNLITVDFLAQEFLMPSQPERLMRNLYGKTWNIPLENIPSRTGIAWKLRRLAQEPGKILTFARRFLLTQTRKTLRGKQE